jgi:RNA polymerase sigma factor (sigma-70 family)
MLLNVKQMEKKSKLRSTIKKLVDKVSRSKAPKAKKLLSLGRKSTKEAHVVPMNGRQGKCGEKLSVQKLLEEYRLSGNQQLAGIIYERHWHLVLGNAQRILNDKEDAQDAAAEIFIKVLDRLRIETPTNFAGWLYTVTRYHCFEMQRKSKQSPILEPLDAVKYLMDNRPDAESIEARHSSLEEVVHQALAHLPAHQRACIELFYMQDASYKEISELEGYGQGEVKSYIQNGKRRLLALLAPLRNRHVSDATC